MSEWGDDVAVSQQSDGQGWGNDTPVAPNPYKPDPVVAPPPAFLKRFDDKQFKGNANNKAILDAFKETYGDQPMISWRPEDIKALQNLGLLNSPDNANDGVGSFFRSFTDPVLKAAPAIPDTIMRGLSGLAGAASEYVGQVAGGAVGGVTGNKASAKEVHDVAGGMSWEAVQAWFVYEMSNGGGFGRVHTDPATGGEINVPVGSLPKESQFTDVATLLGDKAVEPNVKQAYNGQGITPAEIFNDAQHDVTITQDVVTGAKKIKAYEGPATTPAEWVNSNINTLLTTPVEELKPMLKAHGLEFNDVVDYVASQPEVAGRWSESLNDAAVEARVKELEPAAYAKYTALEQKKVGASNAVEKIKAEKEEAKYGVIDQQIEETKAKLASEGGQGKRYKVYQERLKDLKKQREDMALTDPLGDQSDAFNRRIQAARMQWVEHDVNQRSLAPALGKARKQAEEEQALVESSDLPLKEQVTQPSPQAAQPQQTPTQAVQATQANTVGGATPPTPPTGGTPAAPTGAPAPIPALTYDQAHQNILNSISIGGKEGSEKMTWDKLYTRFVDMFNPVRAAIRDQLKSVGINYKTIKNTANDPYIWFRLTKGVFGKTNSFLSYGTRNFHTFQVNGYSLKEILKPVAGDLDHLRTYISSRRTLELEHKGINSGKNVPSAQVVVRDGAARFETVHRQLVDFQNRITEYLKDSGILSEDAYQAMLTANQEYTPFYRHFGDDETPIGKNVSGRLGAKNPMKAIEGSDRDTIDPLESVIRNTYTYLALADKNAAGLKLVDLMNHLNNNYLTLIPSTRTNGMSAIAALMRHSRADNTIAVWRDGVPEVYKVTNNKDLVRAWQGLDQYVASDIVKFLSLPAKSLRAGATLTPDFMFRNFMRDTATAFVTASSHPLRSLEGFYHVLAKSKSYRDWQASGGSNAAMVSIDRHYLQGNIREIISSTNMLKGTWNSITHPIESARAMSELFENATRVGTFLRKDVSTKAGMLEAGYKSREATLDFARMGTQMRGLNMLDAFLNANIQGTDRVVRAFKDDFVGTSARVAAGITLPSLYLWMANHKDPRYTHSHDYEKDLYWRIMTDKWEPISQKDAKQRNIPDYNLRTRNGQLEVQNGIDWKIPKPFELGLLFGSLPERMLDEWYDKNPKALDEWANNTMSAMIPQLLPQFAGVPIEAITNHSFFTGQPVVPDYLKGLLPEYQYTEYTSETAKLLGRAIGAIPGINGAKANPNAPLNGLAQQITSPMILENYVQGWAGGLGMQTLKVVDAGLKMVGVGADKIKPAMAFEDIPFIKSFTVRHPEANPQSLTDFRNHNDMNNTIMNSIKFQIKAQNMQEYDKLMKQYGVRTTLNNTQQAISAQYKIIEGIYNTNGINKKTGKPIYTAQDKRQLIDSYYYSIDQMATQANKMLDQEDKFIAEYKGKLK